MKTYLTCLTLLLGLPLLTFAQQSTPSRAGKFEAQIRTEQDEHGKPIIPSKVRGEDLEVPVDFTNPAVDNDGHSGVLLDWVVRRPDGSVLCESRNVNGWVYLKPAPCDESIESEYYPIINLGPDEPAGLYTVEVTVKDIPGKKQIPLTTHIEFKEKE